MSKAKKRPQARVLDRLTPDESHEVLSRLLKAHPSLRREAENVARSLVADLSFEEVADEVDDKVRSIGFDDLRGRAGRFEEGYVGPGEAALELLDEVVQPFLEDLKRHIELDLGADALELCKGIVLGLYRADGGKGVAAAEWAPDFAIEMAAAAIETWSEFPEPGESGRRKRRSLPNEFVENHLPRWKDMIARLSGTRKPPR